MATIIVSKIKSLISSKQFTQRAIIASISSLMLLSLGYLLFEQTIYDKSQADFSNYSLFETQIVKDASISKVEGEDLDKINQITFTDKYGQNRTIYVSDSNLHVSKNSKKIVVKEWLSKDNADFKYSVEAAK